METTCPDHPKFAARGSCARCGRFICEACDPDRGKHCAGCSDRLAAEAAAPWRARRRRAKVTLGLAIGLVVVTLALHRALEDLQYELLLTLGFCLALVAAAWDGIGWEHLEREPDPQAKTESPVYVVGGGCLLALIAAVAFLASVQYWP